MLSKDLLVVTRRKGVVKPKYLQDTNLAELLIGVFNKFKGRKYKELQEELKVIEEGYKNYKVVRGLYVLLERNCEFETISNLDSAKVRSFLFGKGFITNDIERNQILEQASSFFRVSKEEIEMAFFSDLLEEKLLKKLCPISGLDLIKKYNLSLTQTLLFNALELTILIEENYQQIFKQINYLGVMYEVEKNNSGNFEIKITGPASLFKKTKKYGTLFAKILPYILTTNKWTLSAKIETQWNNEPKIFNFKLCSEDSILLYRNTSQINTFDSNVEEQFYKEFQLYNLGWEIKREPTIIKTKNYITIPDFGFYKHGQKVFLEVVGFWTPEYIKKKIWKLKNAETIVIVAVNQSLNCEKEDFPSDVIFYKKKIPIKPIIKILREIDEKRTKSELDKLKLIEIMEDIASINEKAEELGVSSETLRKLKLDNHYIIGNKIVSQNYLLKVEEKIGNERDYAKVTNIIAEFGLTLKALEYIGYKIEWNGLIPTKIVKKPK